jgi:hypothetical protein
VVREAGAAALHPPTAVGEIEPLLETALNEHEQVGALDETTAGRYRSITARVVLFGGAKSRPQFTTSLFEHLAASIPNTTTELINGLDHTAPDEKAPNIVAERVRHQLQHHAEPAASAEGHVATGETET